MTTWLTTAEVAARLRETPATVHHWCRTGQLLARVSNRSAAAVKLRYMVSEDALADFVRARMAGGRQPVPRRRRATYEVLVP